MVLFSPTHTFSQNSVGNMDTPIFYDAEDSIVGDIPNQIVRLYGNGIVKYDDITLTADVIEVNLKTNEVTATYSKDSLGNKVGKPIFTQGAEEIQCESIKYNFNTEKGYITETRTTQGEGYIHMAETKRQPNGEIHFKDGKYTTCDKEHPHYHFQLSKAIVVPEKRIVTGPMYMKILNVPLPIAAPFAILPNSDTKTHGFLMPTLALGSQYGSGLQNLGYYTPIGEYWETYLYGTIYTSGRWSLENTTNYYKNYKSKGTISLGYSHLSGYFYEDDITNNLQIKWSHTQDAKAHPSLKFNSSINFVSNNNPKSDIDIISDNYYDNQMLSSATLSKSWKLGQFSGSWTTKASMQQYSTTETYTMQLPSFNLNVSRFDLGVLRKNSVGKKWYENIYVTYTLNSANSITSPDSIFNKTYYPLVSDYLLNGVKQNAVIQTNLKPKSGWFTFNLSSTYNELWNFQTYEKYWNDTESRVDTNDFNGFQSGRYINFSGGLSTNLYGYYKSPNQNVKARHVMSPNVTFTYRPDISQYTEYQSDSLGNTAYYSPFDVSLYQESSRGESGLISYSLGNTLDLKTRNKKDSINRSYKSTSLISQLNIGGSYDIFADSMKLSDFTMSLRSSPVSNISIQTGARLSPYSYDTLGNEYDKYAWNNQQGIGRITSANMAITAKFKSKTKNEDSHHEEKDSLSTHKREFPWTANFTYNINYTRNQNGVVQVDTFDLTHTIGWNGQLKIDDKWKFDYTLNYDFIDLEVSTFNLSIWRDLHCWEAGLNWKQSGRWTIGQEAQGWFDPPTSYVLSFQINIKSSMFSSFLPEQSLRIPTDW